jgi:hypothetical protein
MILKAKRRRTRRRTCPSATFSSTNPTWTAPDTNLCLRGEMPATDSLSRFVVDNVALGQVLSEFFGFALSISFHRRSPKSYNLGNA